MRKLLLSILAVTALLATAKVCLAEEAKPLVTVSFAGYDKLLANVNTIGRLGGNPNLGQSLDMILKLMTQGKGLAGLDTKRPWAMVVLTSAQEPFTTCGFLPVTDLKQLMEVAKTNPQLAEAIQLKGEVYEISSSGQTAYVTQKGQWAVLSDKSENLAKAPADPVKLLGDLPERYVVAVRGSMKNLPKEYREQFLSAVRAGAEAGMQQMPAESAEEYALRQSLAKQTVQQLTMLINDLDDGLVGWNVDAKTNSTYLDFELRAQAGTKLAEQLAQVKPGKTEFAGLLLPGAAVTANSIGTLTEAQITQARAALADMHKSLKIQVGKLGLGEEETKLASGLLGDLIDVTQKTVATGKTDAALAVMLDPKAVTILAGAKIADGAKLDKAVQQLTDEVQKNKKAAESLKFSTETYEGIHLHVVSVPTPQEELRPLVGERLEVVLGIAADKLLAAAGRDATKTVKTAIDRLKTTAATDVPPTQITVAVTPIAKFVAGVAEEESVKGKALMLAGLLEKAGGKDHVTITASPVTNGIRVRLEAEEGLLKAIGQLAAPMGMGGMPAPGGL